MKKLLGFSILTVLLLLLVAQVTTGQPLNYLTAAALQARAWTFTAPLKRVGFIAPNGQADYDAATEQERRSAYIGDAQNRVGTAKEDGYYIR